MKSTFPFAMLPQHEGAKQNIIGVARGTSAKLPQCTNLTLIYLMENKIDHPFVHHVVKWWGCDYTIEDDKGLNERT
jgi:hypothetical protein